MNYLPTPYMFRKQFQDRKITLPGKKTAKFPILRKLLKVLLDATKDPPNAWSARGRKIRSSIVGFQQFTMDVVTRENFVPLRTQNKIVNVEMDGATIYRQRFKSDSCHCSCASLLRRRTPFALNPIRL